MTKIEWSSLPSTYAVGGSGVPRTRFRTPWSREVVSDIATLVKQAVTTEKARIDAV